MDGFLTRLSDYLPLTPLATHIGITCLVAQITFTVIFNEHTNLLPRGPWTHLPAFTAHQVVATPSMIMLTYFGWRDWFFKPDKDEEGATTNDRIFAYSNPSDFPLAYGSGAILLWDLPMGFISPPLRDPVMWAHHVGMFMVAATMSGMFCKWGHMIGYYYGSYYFGVIEMSSIFLSFADVFHPKYKHYDEWLNASNTVLGNIVKNMNKLARILFALTFLALRGLYFPYVSFRLAIPDLIQAYKNPPEGVPMWTGYFLIGMISLFACLQAYWGVIIAKLVKKALRSDVSESKVRDE